MNAARDGFGDVGAHGRRARIVDENVGAGDEGFAHGAVDPESRHGRPTQGLGESLTRVLSGDGARELEVRRRRDRGAQPAPDPAGRAGETDADPRAQRAAGSSGTFRITASVIASGAIGVFSFRNFPPWLFATT